MNNKGFTLIELLMVIVLLAIITIVTVPTVGNSLNNSKEKSYQILISNIKTASQSYFEECSYVKTSKCNIKDNKITTNLINLVKLGYLTGTTKTTCDENDSNKCSVEKELKNPKDQEDIGQCEITITKNVDEYGKVSYEVTTPSESSSNSCPKKEDFEVK